MICFCSLFEFMITIFIQLISTKQLTKMHKVLVLGILCLIFLICWYYMVYDSPSQHPRITEAERKYIESAIGESKGIEKKVRIYGGMSSSLQ